MSSRLSRKSRALVEAALARAVEGPPALGPQLLPPTCGDARHAVIAWADGLGLRPLLGQSPPLPAHIRSELRAALATLDRGPSFGHDDEPLRDPSPRLWLDTWVVTRLRRVLAWADGAPARRRRR